MTAAHDTISRKAVLAAIEPLLTALLDMTVTKSDVSIITASVRALPSVGVTGKPEGPQFRELKTCKGCVHFKSEYWREPSGDGETYDSGTSADCLKAGRSISTYFGSEPTPPEWCPLAALDVQPAPDAAQVRAEALQEAADAVRRIPDGWDDGISADFHPHSASQMRMYAIKAIRALIPTPAPSPDVAVTETGEIGRAAAAAFDELTKAWVNFSVAYSAALAQKGGRPQTDYERKLAAMKEDFPNGI